MLQQTTPIQRERSSRVFTHFAPRNVVCRAHESRRRENALQTYSRWTHFKSHSFPSVSRVILGNTECLVGSQRFVFAGSLRLPTAHRLHPITAQDLFLIFNHSGSDLSRGSVNRHLSPHLLFFFGMQVLLGRDGGTEHATSCSHGPQICLEWSDFHVLVFIRFYLSFQ